VSTRRLRSARENGARCARSYRGSSGPCRVTTSFSSAVLAFAISVVPFAAAIPILPVDAVGIHVGQGKNGAREPGLKMWGEATGGVPTREELHAVFPPIPVNLSVTPVVLVPGIGGSVMSDVQTGLLVWIRLYEATYYFQRYMWGRYNETTRTMDPVTSSSPNTGPVTSGFGLDGIRNLDPTVHWPIYNYVTYFDTIISTLESQGWLHGKTLFGVPWDWRQVSTFWIDACMCVCVHVRVSVCVRDCASLASLVPPLCLPCLPCASLASLCTPCLPCASPASLVPPLPPLCIPVFFLLLPAMCP
jgi:hypothetical protein